MKKPNPPDPFAPDAPFGAFALLDPFDRNAPNGVPPKKWTGIKGPTGGTGTILEG